MIKDINWGELGFAYYRTDWNLRSYFRDGQWGELVATNEETIPVHMGAPCLHYGQQSFEGLKAFRGKDGKIRLFRTEENARRMQRSADYLKMAAPSIELFVEACERVVKMNADYVPTYESGASLYLRPLLIGVNAQVGVKPATEYLFVVFAMPVGPYFKEGFRPISVMIDRDHDRAAPFGTGHVKVGGNYAASLLSSVETHDAGYSNVLYLDPATKTNIDECAAANFYGIKGNSYVTPDSHSVLPSITNKSLCDIAEYLGLKVERRQIPVAELAEFSETGACGTAAVISPIGMIYDPSTDTKYNYGTEAGEWSKKLYNTLRGIQYGEIADPFGWTKVIE